MEDFLTYSLPDRLNISILVCNGPADFGLCKILSIRSVTCGKEN